jgi:GT2 family glycosyltransferase
LDGDGQHNPDEVPNVVEPILQDRADIVIGSRFLNKDYTIRKYRKLGIDAITWALNTGAKTKLTDGQCCFRAFSRDALKKILPVEEDGFGFSVEMIVKARRLGLRIIEVPVSCIYHEDSRDDSTINPIWHGVSVLASTIKWRLWEITHSK